MSDRMREPSTTWRGAGWKLLSRLGQAIPAGYWGVCLLATGFLTYKHLTVGVDPLVGPAWISMGVLWALSPGAVYFLLREFGIIDAPDILKGGE